MTLFGTALVVFLYIVGSFRKELYEDRGYLTFTLPLTGKLLTHSSHSEFPIIGIVNEFK